MKEAKNSLRRELAEKVAALSEECITHSDRCIFERFFTVPQYEDAKKIFIYFSMGREPDTVNIISKMLKDGKEVYIPRISCTREMSAGRISGIDGLPTGTLGVVRPLPGCEIAAPEELDIIVVPGIAFDETGGRMGRGGGYYDTYLRDVSSLKIGIAREVMMVSAVPTEKHDVKMNMILTEKRTVVCPSAE